MDEALNHQYLVEGRLRFHSCMCSCCHTNAGGTRVYTTEFETVHETPFDSKWEREVSRVSTYELRERIYKYISDRTPTYGVPLCINPHSAAYKTFAW